MPIEFKCPGCGATHSVPDDKAGVIGKCRCGEKVRVPDAARSARPSPALTPRKGATLKLRWKDEMSGRFFERCGRCGLVLDTTDDYAAILDVSDDVPGAPADMHMMWCHECIDNAIRRDGPIVIRGKSTDRDGALLG